MHFRNLTLLFYFVSFLWSAFSSSKLYQRRCGASTGIVAQREKEIAKLPPDVRALVGKLADAKKIEVLPEKKPELPPEPEARAVPAPRAMLAAAISPRTGRSREEVLAMLREGVRDGG